MGELKDELKKWIASEYRVFWFEYVRDIDAAYWRHCIFVA